MNNYKKLTRSRKNRVIGGVAGGLGEYFDMDPILLRILFIFLTLFGGAGLILYLVLLIVMPEDLSNPFGETVETETFVIDEDGNTIYEKKKENEETESTDGFGKNQDFPRQKNNRIITTAIGLTLIFLGGFILLSHFVSFNWYKYLLPCILLVAGIIILVSSSRSKR